MKNRKHDFIPFSLYDHTGMAAHLEKRAAQGWMLDRITPFGWYYHRIEPKDLHFAVTYYPQISEFDPEPSEEQLTFQDFCAHTGWKLAAAFGPHQFYYNEEEDPLPIQTEPQIELSLVGKAFRRALPIYVVFLFLGFAMGGGWLWELFHSPIDLLSNSSNLFFGLCWLILFLFFAADLTTYLTWRHRAKAAAQRGEFLPTRGCHRILQAFMVVVLLGFLFWLLTDRTPVLRFFTGVFLLITALLYFIANGTKELLKQRKAPAGVNRTVTWVLTFFLSFLIMWGITHSLIQGIRSGSLSFEAESPPLTLSDFTDAEQEDYKTSSSISQSTLVSRSTFWMIPTGDWTGQSLHYSVVDVHVPFLSSICLNQLLHEKDDWEVVNTDGTSEHPYYVYHPSDPGPWGAEAAWQLYTADGTPVGSGAYLLQWANRFVVLEPGTALTPTQMAEIGARLALG